jgi:uncharacterized membrane protein
MVAVHQITVQFCCSGVTGTMVTRIGGWLLMPAPIAAPGHCGNCAWPG